MYTRQNKSSLLLINCLSLLILVMGVLSPRPASASPDPTSVTIAGSLQPAMGCAGTWDPACADSHLTYDMVNDIWRGVWDLPAGSYEYKAAINDSWAENYGLHAAPGGANIPLNLGADMPVRFYYDDKTHWVTDNVNSIIAAAVGSFQQELDCPGDWDQTCLRSWLQDPDGDNTYVFETSSIPAGSYEAKVVINESWDENYGQGGAPGGANIPFVVPSSGSKVTFSYDAATHILSIFVEAVHAHDNNVEWDGLRHDSRDTLYRTPGGAIPAGTPVTVRFRTFHNDVTGVVMRVYDINTSTQRFVPMQLAASDVSCYQAGLEDDGCDYWQAALNEAAPDNLWYRFIVTDGSKQVYYADNTPALDGGLGSPSDNLIDNSYALMFFQPGFQSPSWMKDAVIYQIFPDRFFNGRKDNDPKTGQIRYDEPVLKLTWGVLPEGFCRAYADNLINCPWRFDPYTQLPQPEGPRRRDYFGGDLKGVDQNLEYFLSLGVNTLYFNPIFDSGSNHGYDTQDYKKIDPYFGTQKDWDNLVKHANKLGIRIVLDGVFNHMSSDSPFFDRYHHYAAVGACESQTSQYRSWFTFHDVAPGTGTCVSSTGAEKGANYDGWFGFDSIPVLNKSLSAVQQYFLTNSDSVTKTWLSQGASGWRLDVMGDSSFPINYWQTFRGAVKSSYPDAAIIGELWQKDSTLLRFLRGDLADTTMNYRLRDAVVGLLTPLGGFDGKGFADSGRQLSASEFAGRLASIQEDYPQPAFYSLMNLVGSHDTARILWLMTPGEATAADKELNTANLAVGKNFQKIASVIQFTLPGAPTIYYGDEVGMTGNDDPDDRRTYPWAELGGMPDADMFANYQNLAAMRSEHAVFTDGDFRLLLADDAAGVVAYGRKTASQAALVVINDSMSAQVIQIPVAGYLPDGVALGSFYGVNNAGTTTASVSGGVVEVSLDPESVWVLGTDTIDLQPPAAPAGLHIVSEGNSTLSFAWDAVSGAVGYNLYRSPVTGGGYIRVNSTLLIDTALTDTGLRNAQYYYYTATAVDEYGNESAFSTEAVGMPHYTIGWANLQWPPTITHTISAINRTENVYGQVWIDGVTNLAGLAPSLRAQLGFGPQNSDPSGNPAWTWVEAAFNVDAGNNDEFMASMLPEYVGVFDYAYRYSTTNGADWIYADHDGTGNGYDIVQAGKMTVLTSGDSTPPDAPTGLNVVLASPTGIQLAWDAVIGDLSLYGYEVLRSNTSGGGYAMVARVTDPGYTDTEVVEGTTYYYVVRALDTSFNRSGSSNEVVAAAEPRTVTVTFNVTVPALTPLDMSVYIAGTLDRLDGGLPSWNPSGVILTKVDDTHWTVTLTGKEAVEIEYKYTLGSWNYVEKGAVCEELGNRTLTLTYGADGIQTVNDTVLNWRSLNGCPAN